VQLVQSLPSHPFLLLLFLSVGASSLSLSRSCEIVNNSNARGARLGKDATDVGRGEICTLPADPTNKTDKLADVLATERRRQGREDDRFRERGRRRSDLRHSRGQRGHRQRAGLEQDRDV